VSAIPAYGKPLGLGVALLVAFVTARVLAEPAPQALRETPAAVTPVTPAPVPAPEPARSARPTRAGYQVEPVQNGGTIRVTCRLSKPLTVQEVPFSKDKGPGKCGHDSMKNERALFDTATLGLQNCVVYLADITKGKEFEGALAEPDAEVIFDQKECRFRPHVVLYRVGSRVSVRNSDDVSHNAKGYYQNKATLRFNILSSPRQTLPPSDDTTLDKAGNYIVNCDIHLWMTAYMRAVQHPYFAVSGTDGTCSLTNVPPGKYRLACWHEGMLLTLETTGAEISGYRYSEDFNAPDQVITVPAGGAVDAEFVIDPR
jgi:plastocyanin